MQKYHRKVYFEPDARLEAREYLKLIDRIVPTKHFIDRLIRKISLPSFHELQYAKLIEYQRNALGDIERMLICCPNKSKIYDYFYVITPGGYVITGWKTPKGREFVPNKLRYAN